MRFYFLSEYPSAVKLNGLYLGQIYPNHKFLDVNLDDNVFVEICPMVKGETPYSFLLNKDFLGIENPDVIITDLDGGYFIKFLRTFKTQDFCLLAQERFSDALITVFTENGIKVSIESMGGFFAEELNSIFTPISAKISRFSLGGCEFVAVEIISQKDKYLAVYTLFKDVKRVYFDKIESYCIDNGLSIETVIFDTLKHKVSTEYEYKNGALSIKSKSVVKTKPFDLEKAHDLTLPYLFLEELLVGGDVSCFLSEDLKNSCDKIKEYFGDFLGVMPPPSFKDYDLVGVIYKKSSNQYFVKYAKFELVNKKIVNFKLQ